MDRDLHDGIQQRLIALTFRARAMARQPLEELPESVAHLADGLRDTSDELREVSRGIHPTILTEAGLGPALRALARRVRLVAGQDDGVLNLEVRDDGVGGVDAERGSGVLGLTDRVEALGGTIAITSPPSQGTAVSVRLPISP